MANNSILTKIGDVKSYPDLLQNRSLLRCGWLPCNGGTIGNSSSNAEFMGDKYKALFDVLSKKYNLSLKFSSGQTIKLPTSQHYHHPIKPIIGGNVGNVGVTGGSGWIADGTYTQVVSPNYPATASGIISGVVIKVSTQVTKTLKILKKLGSTNSFKTQSSVSITVPTGAPTILLTNPLFIRKGEFLACDDFVNVYAAISAAAPGYYFVPNTADTSVGNVLTYTLIAPVNVPYIYADIFYTPLESKGLNYNSFLWIRY